jgi:hypothetical protein
MAGRRPDGFSAPPRDGTQWAAYAACAWATIFAAASFYWGAGGDAGVDTIAAKPDEIALISEPAVVWGTGALKLLVGGGLALALASPPHWVPPRGLVLVGRLVGGFLIVYGGASLVQHALMVTGAIGTPATLGEHAARWHLALWDPWWILGGALFWVAAHGRA